MDLQIRLIDAKTRLGLVTKAAWEFIGLAAMNKSREQLPQDLPLRLFEMSGLRKHTTDCTVSQLFGLVIPLLLKLGRSRTCRSDYRNGPRHLFVALHTTSNW